MLQHIYMLQTDEEKEINLFFFLTLLNNNFKKHWTIPDVSIHCYVPWESKPSLPERPEVTVFNWTTVKKNEFFSLKLSLNSNVSAKLHLVKLICKLKLKIEL